ncbi:carbamoyltransferase HypF [Thiomicrospira microaerophila]|uniref:carbamoyltransferase HypF n=1 Tax=Thiomicrospira microaerophila TaxID=406020 RepID=UPI00200CA074|nr:carbamoyltransferase HypF [Thiomicrospira microaerophila]UQB42519.1 carbamoyltransferase HypF [Thiomicrospira microaerophila]
MSSLVCQRWVLSGRVQGVGMRPYSARLAQGFGIVGWVVNHPQGVELVLQAGSQQLSAFRCAFEADLPSLAQIDQFDVTPHAPIHLSVFEIRHTPEQASLMAVAMLPDRGVCASCLAELFDPASRRYHDAFIQCSDCGPRYSVTHRLPFERAHTSLHGFPPCQACQQEYQASENRRFHCQGITCPDCSPQLNLLLADARGGWQSTALSQSEMISQAAQLLLDGEIIAIKGVGGYHLVCDARQTAAVARLRQIKLRPAKPFALLCRDLDMAKTLVQINPHNQAWLENQARPIVLIDKQPNVDTMISQQVAPDIRRLGVMLAYTPLHYLLFEQLPVPLVVTSANRSGEPILYQNAVVQKQFAGKIAGILDHNREIVNPSDDSVVQCINQPHYQTLRLGRGLAPLYLPLDARFHGQFNGRVGLGGQQKSTVALGLEQHIMLMPYSGDLSSLAAQARFEQQIQTGLDLYQLRASKLIGDLHPNYVSSQWGQTQSQQQGIAWQAVQHHYAHLLATMAEYQLDEPVIGLVWDGNGYGEQGQLWGGEVMLADRQGYQHLFGLRPIRLLGGEQAMKQPRRIALAWLFGLMPLESVLNLDCPTTQAFTQTELRQLYQLYQTGLNSPLSSSVGRLFDGLASLLGLVHQLDYEGQSGLLLETYYDSEHQQAYALPLSEQGWDSHQLIKAIWQDYANGVKTRWIVSRFFNALVNAVAQVSERYPDKPLVLSGGVFQNVTLMQQLSLKLANRRWYSQQSTPINDGGLALGQVFQFTMD